MTDYRWRLLEFLDKQSDWTGNVLPIVEEYLAETKKTARISFDSNVLRPLEGEKRIVVYADARTGLSSHQNGRYLTDVITVCMTYQGHDYLEELRKRNLAASQPILAPNIVFNGPVNTGHIRGDQRAGSHNLNPATPKKSIWNSIVLIFIAVVAALIVWYFTKLSR